jgi:Lysylphosphatidylglycerol synthase TM region
MTERPRGLPSEAGEAVVKPLFAGLITFLKRNGPAIVSLTLLGAAILYLASRKDELSAVVAAWRRIDTPDLFGAIGLIMLSQLSVAWRCCVIFEADGLHRPNLFWSNLRIQMVTLFASHGAIIPGFADVAKATMVKLRFDISAARSVKLVVYERMCSAIGYMMVGLLATLPLYFLRVRPLLVVVPLMLWLVGFAMLGVILVLVNRQISTGYARIDWLISTFMRVGQLYQQRRSFIELFLCALMQLLLVAGTFLLLSRAMAMPIEPAFIFLFIPFIFFIASLPIFYMGWGGREAVVIMTLGAVGHLPTPEALALSASYGVIIFLASLPGAVFWLTRPSMRKAVTRSAVSAPPQVDASR